MIPAGMPNAIRTANQQSTTMVSLVPIPILRNCIVFMLWAANRRPLSMQRDKHVRVPYWFGVATGMISSHQRGFSTLYNVTQFEVLVPRSPKVVLYSSVSGPIHTGGNVVSGSVLML